MMIILTMQKSCNCVSVLYQGILGTQFCDFPCSLQALLGSHWDQISSPAITTQSVGWRGGPKGLLIISVEATYSLISICKLPLSNIGNLGFYFLCSWKILRLNSKVVLCKFSNMLDFKLLW